MYLGLAASVVSGLHWGSSHVFPVGKWELLQCRWIVGEDNRFCAHRRKREERATNEGVGVIEEGVNFRGAGKGGREPEL